MSIPNASQRNVLHVMIVGSEDHERCALKEKLADLNGIEIVSEAFNAKDAVVRMKDCYARQAAIDAMFIDVDLPDASGVVFAKALLNLQSPPAVVFVSADGEEALDAFDVQAVDYLVRPIEPGRLALAVSRALRHKKMRAMARRNEKIPVNVGMKKAFLKIDDIRFAMANDDFAYLQTDGKRYLVPRSLSQLEETLAEHGFFRVHRSFLVNLNQINEIEPCSSGRFMLSFDGLCDKVPVSRRRASQLKSMLGV